MRRHKWLVLCGFGDGDPINYRCQRCGRLSMPLITYFGPMWPWPRCKDTEAPDA